MQRQTSVSSRLWAFAVWALVVFFVVNLLAMIARRGELVRHALVQYLAAGRLDDAMVSLAWNEFQLADILLVTVEVVGAVVLLAGLIGVPAAYAMARREFPGKRLVMLLFLLPLLVPPITYGIPLATVLYQRASPARSPA